MRFLHVILASVCALLACHAAHAQERTLSTALEVRSLSPAEADQGLKASLRGIVVYVERNPAGVVSAVFLQDETSTTFFRTIENRPALDVGDEIALEAKTRMGLYLPGLTAENFRVLGRRPLPPGIPVQYDDLHFSRYHYQRVSAEGVVRSASVIDRHHTLVRLALGSRVIEARVDASLNTAPALVGCRARITGLAAGLINTPRRQMVQPYLRVIGWEDIEIVAPAPPPGDVPQISAEELLAFRVTGHGDQRVRIEGRVSATFGPDLAYLIQGTSAFAVRLALPATLQIGDRVSVIGFPTMDRFSASVMDAEVLSQEPGPAPEPTPISKLEQLYGEAGRFDGQLVRATATVRDVFKTDSGFTLLVGSGKHPLHARMPPEVEAPPIGARISLVGICQVETVAPGSGFASRPELVSLRSRAASDIVVLDRPSWWTPQRLTTAVAACASVILLAALWIAALRRQVARQTAALAVRIQSEAALAERQRIAREFHDTLEQELAGVSLRLDAVATRPLDEKGRGLVAAARNLVSRIQTETRELISDLRDATETAGDLPSALAAVATRQAADSGAEVRFEARTAAPTLPAAIVHDLRMIARESVTNALKHGRASHVHIELAVRAGDCGRASTPPQLCLRIADNGCGFDPASALETRHGHFGCAGIRERSRKIGAEVTWHSELQRGTTVEVRYPLEAGAVAALQPAPEAGQPPAASAPLTPAPHAPS